MKPPRNFPSQKKNSTSIFPQGAWWAGFGSPASETSRGLRPGSWNHVRGWSVVSGALVLQKKMDGDKSGLTLVHRKWWVIFPHPCEILFYIGRFKLVIHEKISRFVCGASCKQTRKCFCDEISWNIAIGWWNQWLNGNLVKAIMITLTWWASQIVSQFSWDGWYLHVDIQVMKNGMNSFWGQMTRFFLRKMFENHLLALKKLFRPNSCLDFSVNNSPKTSLSYRQSVACVQGMWKQQNTSKPVNRKDRLHQPCKSRIGQG